MERRSFTHCGFHPYPPVMALDYLFANRQPNTCACVLVNRMESLENVEDSVEMLRRDPYPVVCDGKYPSRSLLLR